MQLSKCLLGFEYIPFFAHLMRVFFLVLLVLISTSGYPENDESSGAEFGQELLSIGKLSGACGIFKLQIEFQENTKLEGGEKFIERFWTTEAARLGKSLEGYAAACHQAVSGYSTYFDFFENK